MGKFIDLTGQKFGRLTVIKRAENIGRYSAWLCKCDCGKEKIINGNSLKSGLTRSCGCISRGRQGKHCVDLIRTKLYGVWRSMKSRCSNPKVPVFKNYGGRGISVCDEWVNDFEAFHSWAFSSGYTEKLTIERIDNNKGYSPDNCRWATPKEQTRNRRKTLIVNGKTLGEWVEILDVEYNTLLYRYNKGKLECFKTNIDNKTVF